MSVDPRQVVEELFAARASGDLIKLNALCTEAFAFTYNVDPDDVGQGTTVIGWDGTNRHLARVAVNWQSLERKVLSMTLDCDNPNQVNVQMYFKLLHVPSQQELAGVKRQEWIIRNGIATSATEIFDQKTIHAFQRFAAWTISQDTATTDRAVAPS